MRKLISANFARLWKDKVFWIGAAAMMIYSAVYVIDHGRQAKKFNIAVILDEYYFFYAVIIGVFCAVFAALFIGRDYGDGTIRNKLIIGRRRFEIYLSNLLTVFTATLLVMAAWLTGALAGIPVLGTWAMGAPELIKYLLVSVLFVAAFSAIFTLVGMLCTNKAITAVLTILLFFGLLLVGGTVKSGLDEPEMVLGGGVMVITGGDGDEVTSTGNMEPIPNPRYLTGFKRQVYEFLLDFLPSGQTVTVSFAKVENSYLMMFYSAFITVLFTASGIFVFNRKNIK
jgi:ABC-type transport system involved in multi-copper enzyme maturation permease subunit